MEETGERTTWSSSLLKPCKDYPLPVRFPADAVCGYVYDPAEHDGVAFEDLPADWKCPRCKQSKDKFNRA